MGQSSGKVFQLKDKLIERPWVGNERACPVWPDLAQWERCQGETSQRRGLTSRL